jgi:hypothetical protein
MLSFHIHQILPHDPFHSGFSTKILYAFLTFPMRVNFPSYVNLIKYTAADASNLCYIYVTYLPMPILDIRN